MVRLTERPWDGGWGERGLETARARSDVRNGCLVVVGLQEVVVIDEVLGVELVESSGCWWSCCGKDIWISSSLSGI